MHGSEVTSRLKPSYERVLSPRYQITDDTVTNFITRDKRKECKGRRTSGPKKKKKKKREEEARMKSSEEGNKKQTDTTKKKLQSEGKR